MATVANALTFARAQVQTDINGLTDVNGLVFANEALVDFRRRLVNDGVDAAQIQEAYRDASANVGTYLYPTAPALLFLKAIELNYTDNTPQNYRQATQVDVSNLSGQTSFSWLRQNANTFNPKFDDHGDWFEIFPTPTSSNNLTSLIRIIYFAQPTEFSSTSDTISYPESLDYRILGWRIASNYLYSLLRMDEGDKFNAKYEERVKQYVNTLGKGSQQPLQPEGLAITGWEF